MVSRRIIQGISAFLTNANWKGFRDGTIYNGDTKALCVPGLNCYSCPGAVGGCPIGALQSSLSGFIPRIPFYVLGFSECYLAASFAAIYVPSGYFRIYWIVYLAEK